MAQTNRHKTHPGGHGYSMTELAQWGRFSENGTNAYTNMPSLLLCKIVRSFVAFLVLAQFIRFWVKLWIEKTGGLTLFPKILTFLKK